MNKSRILLGLILIVGSGGALATGTSAFFSDTETSTGNTFTAGSIDLLVDNESYSTNEQGEFVFDGILSWAPTNLDDQGVTLQKFFNYGDMKPDDRGEDTISLHVQNDAYACMNMTLTANDDNETTEPEGEVDPEDPNAGANLNDGELAQTLQMFWWADDGDNVFEEGEETISNGVQTLSQLAGTSPFSVALADSLGSIWPDNGPIPAGQPRFIGKMWCFGTLTPAPLTQDGVGDTGTPGSSDSTNGPIARGTGFTCDGTGLGNETQTDSAFVDIEFRAVQARNNPNFTCTPQTTLTLVKNVENNGVGLQTSAAWTLSASGPTPGVSGTSGSANVTNKVVVAGQYNLDEDGPLDYAQSNWVCVGGTQDDQDTVTIAAGQQVTCTVTNTFAPQACTAGTQYADATGTFDQGRQRNGGAIAGARSNPATATGAPQSTGAATDAGIPVGTFVSLGFATSSPVARSASLILNFTNNIIINGAGPDVKVYEVTNGAYPDEHIKVDASQDGVNWTTITANGIRDVSADLGALAWAKFIRVTDLTNPGDFTTTDPAIADGYDVDAVEALNCALPQSQLIQ